MPQSSFRRLTARLTRPQSESERRDARRGKLLLEGLERRQLMAGDVDLFATAGAGADDVPVDRPLAAVSQAEGEAAPDLVAFAEALAQVGAQFYGADWCPACKQQKAIFGDGGDDLPFVEVTNPDRSLNAVGQAAGITQYPTWDFPSGQRVTGVQSLEDLSALAGVPIPSSDVPSFETVGDQTVAIGSPLHVVVDAYDPGGGPTTTTVTVADPTLVEATVLTGNRSIRIDVDGYGEMVFQLFEGRAPRTTGQIIDLVQRGFYDAETYTAQGENPILFQRVIDNFVLQAGDPTGTGAGGSDLPDVDDEFHPDLQHNREGVLSFAKAGDDTNNSQFFITETPTRFLDFNHSVMGQLIEGFDVREAISRTATNNDRPINDVTIRSVEVFEDTENSLVMLKPIAGTGATQMTVTVTDEDGNTSSETVDVFVVNDSSNSQPYLNDVPVADRYDSAEAAVIQLTSVDVEGDPVSYTATTSTAGAAASVDAAGRLTVDVPDGFEGPVDVTVRVRAANGSTGDFDQQVIRLDFEPTDPGGLIDPPPSRAFADRLYEADINFRGVPEDGSVTFDLPVAPAGATVDAQSGVIRWTPVLAQVGPASFTVRATDAGGAVVGEHTFQVTVDTASMAYRLAVTDTSGATIGQVEVGDEFLVTLAADDTRRFFDERLGVFSGYADILFDPAVVEPVPGSEIEYLAPFTQFNRGVFGDGIVDNVGGVSTSLQATQVADNPLATIRFRAIGGGDANLRTREAGDNLESLIFGEDVRITADNVDYGSANLTVASDFVALDDFVTVAEDSGATTIGVLDNDGSGGLVVTSVTQPASGGTATIVDGGAAVQFTPASDFVGVATFTYAVADGAGTTGEATVTVTVTDVEDPPVAVDDAFSATAGGDEIRLDVLANDSTGPDAGETIRVSGVSGPTTGGTVRITDDGSAILYTPPSAAAGVTEESFTYVITDGDATAEATVVVTLDAAPTAVDDALTVAEDAAEAGFDVTANDVADVDGQAFTIVGVGTPSAGGEARVNADGTRLLYRPAANFVGTETVTYTIADTGGGRSTATATFTVTGVNDPPPSADFVRRLVRNNDPATSRTVLTIDELGTNVDAGETLTFTGVTATNATAGTATISADGSRIEYTPRFDSPSAVLDTVTYTVTDPSGATAGGVIEITVANYELRTVRVTLDTTSVLGSLGTGSSIGQVRLIGKDINDDDVDRVATVDDEGLMFEDLLPGDYEVEIPAVPFLQNARTPQRLPLTSAVDDGDATVEASLGNLRASFVSMSDFFGSRSRSSVLVAARPGDGNGIVIQRGANQRIDNVRASLSADGDQLTLSGNDPTSSAALSGTASVSDRSVSSRGRIDGMSVYRVDLSTGGFDLGDGGGGASTSAAGTSLAGTDAVFSDTDGDTLNLDDLLASDGLGESIDATDTVFGS